MMGNKHSLCCEGGSPPASRRSLREDRYQPGGGGGGGDGELPDGPRDHSEKDESVTNLQHISEREPDDLNDDPSLHPTVGPLFVERSRSNIESECSHCSQLANIYLCAYVRAFVCGLMLHQLRMVAEWSIPQRCKQR